MKTILLFLTLVLPCALAAQTEETAIKAAIEGESMAYHRNTDRKAFLAFWHITPQSRMVYSGLQGRAFVDGAQMEPLKTSGVPGAPDMGLPEFSNWLIRVGGTVAWATFDQQTTYPDGKVSHLHEFRCMEKIDGQWKIVGSSVHEF